MKVVIGIACFLVGAAAGFGFMFWVAKEMVRKVRSEETARHTALLNQVADREGEWMDVVNDILEAVQMGKLQNKSVPDQVRIVRNVIEDSRKRDEQQD